MYPPGHSRCPHCCRCSHRTDCPLQEPEYGYRDEHSQHKVLAPVTNTHTLTGVAGLSFPSILAFTVEIINQVPTSTSIVARIFTAVIYV